MSNSRSLAAVIMVGFLPFLGACKQSGTTLGGSDLSFLPQEASDVSSSQSFGEPQLQATEVQTNVSVSGAVPAKISTQPVDKQVALGQSTSLSGEASGSEPISYQWQRWRPAESTWYTLTSQSSTTSTLKLKVDDPDTAGVYRLRVVNKAGRDYSRDVTVSLSEQVISGNDSSQSTSGSADVVEDTSNVNNDSGTITITSQPSSKTVVLGDSVTFKVVASDAGARYKWTKNGSVIGNSGPTLSFASVKSLDEATYGCKVISGSSSASCRSFKLVVNEAPSIVSQPVSVDGYEGGSAKMKVKVAGKPTPTVKWYRDGKLVKSGSTISATSLSMADAGEYKCVVSNSVGKVNCKSATLNVLEKVRIVKHPSNQIIEEGEDIELAVKATGAAPLKYECYRGSTLVVSANNPSRLVVPNSDGGDNGNYHCVVSNGGSEAVTASANVTVMVDDLRSITLSWNRPTRREDGKWLPVREIDSYSVYTLETKNSAPELKVTVPSDETGVAIDDLNPGTHYLAITTTDVSGLESSLSDIITVTLD